MSDPVLEAIDGSIVKWEKIVSGEVSDCGTKNCPLCRMFYIQVCVGCPVASRAGASLCRKTPYADWDYHNSVVLKRNLPYRVEKDDLKGRVLAAKELRFLKSVRRQYIKENHNEQK